MNFDEEPVVENGQVICHECNNGYDRVGYHWSNGRCDFPTMPGSKKELCTGLMLGDGTLRTHTSNPFIQTYMINRPFLEWLDEELAWLSTGVSMYRDAEHSAKLSRDNGHPDADAENYHDVYVMQTRTMPFFSMYEDWYDDGSKSFPDHIVLTPTTAKIWYACDGSLNWDRRYPNSRPHATIGVQSEMENIDNVLRMFNESTFAHEPTVDESTIRFTVDQTEDFLDWMGDAPGGFEYKWETKDLDRYEELKAEALGD